MGPCKAAPQGRTVRVRETERVLGWGAHLGAPPDPGFLPISSPFVTSFQYKNHGESVLSSRGGANRLQTRGAGTPSSQWLFTSTDDDWGV